MPLVEVGFADSGIDGKPNDDNNDDDDKPLVAVKSIDEISVSLGTKTKKNAAPRITIKPIRSNLPID